MRRLQWYKCGAAYNKSDMLLKPYNKYRAVSYELDAYERKKNKRYYLWTHLKKYLLR